MPWQPAPPPLLSDENANELGKWAQQQMEQLAAALENPDITAYRVLHVEPEKPREGQIVVADGSDWDPGDGAGQYMYLGGQWVIQRSGPEPNTYGVMTDGTTSAPAETAGDTFKFRGGVGLTPIVQNDDATHGDNVQYSLTFGGLTLTTPVLGDKLPFGDISDSDNPKYMTPQTLLDLIGSLSTEASPDVAADFLALFDASGSVAKKVALSGIGRKVLISSTNASGSTVNITIPSGYTDVELHVIDVSLSANAQVNMQVSQNAGSSFLTTPGYIDGDALISNANLDELTSVNISSGEEINGMMLLHLYESTDNKLITGYILESQGPNGYWHIRIPQSTAALNLIRLTTTGGTFDAGKFILYGVP